MKKLMNNPVFTFILGALVFGGFGVYAGTLIAASDVTYNSTTAKAALDDLYTKVNTMKTVTEYNNAVNSSQIGSVSLEPHPTHGAWVRCTIKNKAGQVIYDRYD